MQIKILGVGGAINDGLPYNSFLVNGEFLCETPPDIMLSLSRSKVDPLSIKTIFVSHFHADHFFGLPFLLIHLFILAAKHKTLTPTTIVGPAGVREKSLELLSVAFTAEHPYVDWAERNFNFQPIDESTTFEFIPGYNASFFKMDHFSETYGFLLEEDRSPRFAYIADTVWCQSVERILQKRPKVVFIDQNGSAKDRIPVHLSRQDLVERAFPITGNSTHYYATHLKNYQIDETANLSCARDGMRVPI